MARRRSMRPCAPETCQRPLSTRQIVRSEVNLQRLDSGKGIFTSWPLRCWHNPTPSPAFAMLTRPCICETSSSQRLKPGRGRSQRPGPREAVGERESPRPQPRRSGVRTVAGAASRARMAQGGTRSAAWEANMAGSAVAVYVGIDVSKAQLEVAIRPSGERFSEANDARAVRRLVKRLAPLGCTRIVVEATGGYHT